MRLFSPQRRLHASAASVVSVMQLDPIRTLVAAIQGEVVCLDEPPPVYVGIATDSRKVGPGNIFWALRGKERDGHEFVREAFLAGAIAAVVERDWAAEGARTKRALRKFPCLIAVTDTLESLWSAARVHRAQRDAFVIGITGSVGKTTTRHMIHSVLSSRFSGMQSPLNYNNHVGLPLSLLAVKPQDEFSVLELAASGVGEIARLAELAQPEIGVITAIAPAHLEQFGSLEAVCRAKGELLEALPKTGFAVLNGDDELVRRLAGRANCRVLLVGERGHNDLVASRVQIENRQIRFQVGNAEFTVPAAGRHHLVSALISVAIGREIDLDDAEIADGLRNFTAAPGRCDVATIGDWTVIDDAYNANPGSMSAACRLLRDWTGARQRVLVLGDMLALGPQARELHQQLGVEIAGSGIDRLIAFGAQADVLAGAARSAGVDGGCVAACSDLETATMLLECCLEPGDVILVKGSRGMRMERVIEHLRTLAAAPRVEPLRKAA